VEAAPGAPMTRVSGVPHVPGSGDILPDSPGGCVRNACSALDSLATRTRPVLRLIFVFGIIAIGAFYSLHGPFYALLFYLWNAYFRPDYWVWNDIVMSLRLSLILGAFLVLTSLTSLANFRTNRLVWLVLLFFLQSAISVLTSEYEALAMPFWIEFLKVIVVTLLITVLVNSPDRFRLTLTVIAYSLGFEAAKQGWAQLVLNPGATNNNPHVMLGDNNGVALGMMMLIPIFIALSQTTDNRWEKYVHRFFIGGVVYRGISTYSRGGFLSAAVVGMVSLWRSKHKVRTIVAVGILALTISSVMPQTFWDRMNTITASGDERDDSAQFRLYFWGLAIDMARDHPVLGVGFNSYRYAFGRYHDEGGQRAVHSIWFGVLSELGYPGLILFVAILLTAIQTCHRIRRQAAARGLTNIAAYASHLQTSVVVFMVGGSFLNLQYLELLWHIIGLTVALDHICARATADLDVPAPAAAVLEPVPVQRLGAPRPSRPRSAAASGGFFPKPETRP
jgi:putative inorganic carbon (HCO3(-)) transporter